MTTSTGRATIRRRSDAVTVVVGGVVLALGMAAVRDSDVPALEEDLFRLVNGLPDALYPVLWPFQQAGALLVGPLVALVAAVLRRWRLALGALLATVAKLVTERLVKAAVTRERPGTSIGLDIEARGDVSLRGESFVSGHAILVTALAVLVLPRLHGRWRILPVAAVALVVVGRVYVGAHAPLDVVCGAGLGAAIGGALNLALGVPAAGARGRHLA